MENVRQQYLRILDLDSHGDFIRLINTSVNRSIDLSRLTIEQVTRENSIVNSFRFDDEVKPFLPQRQVVTIYSKDAAQVQCQILPHLFVAMHVSRWIVDPHIQTKLSTIDRYQFFLPSDNDIPSLFLSPFVYSQPKFTPMKTHKLAADLTGRYPYCYPIDHPINPHRTILSSPRGKRHEKNFDFYPRRLTTAPKGLDPM